MIVKVLLALKTMSTDGHAMVRGIDDVGVVQFSHSFQLLQYPPDLKVDVLAAGEFAPHLVSNGSLVPLLPDAFHAHFVSHRGMSMVEGMPG